LPVYGCEVVFDPGLAILRIDADNLKALELGDSSSLEVGDFVVAIGNPFDLGQTVTSGIVSALGRSGLNIEGYEDFIQTDASINPGNSGGALVDLDGRLVGINTAIIAPGGGNVGIGFAVPTHMAAAVMEQLLEYGEVRRGRLGIMIQDVTPDLAEALDIGTVEGAVVTQVEPDSAAEKASLKAGDVVIAVGGRPVSGSAALRNLIGLMQVGEEVEVTVLRDGRRRNIEAEIGKAQASTLAGGRSLPKVAGAEFRNLDRSDPQYSDLVGVLVAQVEQGSPAWRNGLRNGDVILSVNRQRVGSVGDLSEAFEQAGPTVALNILRGSMRPQEDSQRLLSPVRQP
jgi:serine protease DegQ